MFIVFEGIDGSGKSTQMALLHSALGKRGVDLLSVREPGSTPIGEQLRSVLHDGRNVGMTPTCEMLIYAAARAQLMETVVLPALEAGRVVLCDRFFYSSIAYQVHGRGQGDDFANFTNVVNRKVTSCTLPTAVIYLDLPVSEAMARRRGDEAHNYLDSQSEAFYKRVKAGYAAVANPHTWGGFLHVTAQDWHTVDALGTPEEVHGRVLATFERIISADHGRVSLPAYAEKSEVLV